MISKDVLKVCKFAEMFAFSPDPALSRTQRWVMRIMCELELCWKANVDFRSGP